MSQPTDRPVSPEAAPPRATDDRCELHGVPIVHQGEDGSWDLCPQCQFDPRLCRCVQPDLTSLTGRDVDQHCRRCGRWPFATLLFRKRNAA